MAGPRIVKMIADLAIFNQSKGKSGYYTSEQDITIFNQAKGNSGSYAHATHLGMQNHSKCKSLLHLTSLK
jgi:hypothetical protein